MAAGASMTRAGDTRLAVEPGRRELDLRGVRCPLSWAKARVVLDTLTRGEELDLVVDDPQAARDIPRAAEAVGHHVAGMTAEAGSWRITIEV